MIKKHSNNMKKIDRTGAVTQNKRSQSCRITAYRNNKDVDVQIVDTAANRVFYRRHVRYKAFIEGRVCFDAKTQGEPWRNKEVAFTPKQTLDAINYSRPCFECYANLTQDEAQGRAIGCTLAAVCIIAFIALIASFLYFFS